MEQLKLNQLSRILIKGFKSIQECDVTLNPINLLIGANGAGKSNFIGFFNLIQQMAAGNLASYVNHQGGPDAILHFGRKVTPSLCGELEFNADLVYRLQLNPKDNTFFVKPATDAAIIMRDNLWNQDDPSFASIKTSWKTYHFHDTHSDAKVKQLHGINDNIYLRPDASNLAAFLFLLKEKYLGHYQQIVNTIRLVAPFFGDFCLRPNPLNKSIIELEWFERGHDIPFNAYRLSDGTLRFICLTTVLLQPEELRPATIIIDEPELGLHPYAIQILASMIRSESHTTQFIIATQSTNLVSEFEPEDIIIADRVSDKTDLHRISDPEKLKAWLEDYSLGELWEKNLLGGNPNL